MQKSSYAEIKQITSMHNLKLRRNYGLEITHWAPPVGGLGPTRHWHGPAAVATQSRSVSLRATLFASLRPVTSPGRHRQESHSVAGTFNVALADSEASLRACHQSVPPTASEQLEPGLPLAGSEPERRAAVSRSRPRDQATVTTTGHFRAAALPVQHPI